MKQDIENQYDDDLTLGTYDNDDSYYTDADDLFDFTTSDESPISRLKSLVLSIDWEITDEVLLQFNEELIDLKGIWADNKINLVYVQALEKLSKYIYQNKANSHPNAIKLLLTFYYNLEKIVSSEDLSESQKQAILLEDVKKFEVLKRQISHKAEPARPPSVPRPSGGKLKKVVDSEDKLLNLKAIVLGIDWEITDQDLNNLRNEVVRLEEKFADSKPKLILLQGIGTLGAYIKTKKSNAHADAFNVLHLFYESLEKIVKVPMSIDEEKAILFPAVDKFNEFKKLIGPTLSPEAIRREDDNEEGEEIEEGSSGEIAPALADVAEEETIGFQADEEAKSLGIDNTERVASHIDSFFGGSFSPGVEGEPNGVAGGGSAAEEDASPTEWHDTNSSSAVERAVALQGVDVEGDDEEEGEDYQPGVAALADVDDEAVDLKESPDAATDEAVLAMEEEPLEAAVADEEIAKAADSLFPDAEEPFPANLHNGIDREVALQGVNVETEADEDSDEESLPMEGEEIAPALVASEEESLFSAKTLENTAATGGINEEITGTLDGLFEEDQATFPVEKDEDTPDEVLLEEVPAEDEILLPGEELRLEEPVSNLAAECRETGEAVQEPADAAAKPLSDQGEDLDLFFAGGELEQSSEESAAVDSLFEELEPALIDEEEPAAADIEVALDSAEEGYLGEPGEEPFGNAIAQLDEVLPAEEEISVFTEDVTPAENEFSPADDELTLAEEETTPMEEAVSLAEEEAPAWAPAFGEDTLADEGLAPAETTVAEEFNLSDEGIVPPEASVADELALAVEEPFAQVLPEMAAFAAPDFAEETSVIAAKMPPAEERPAEEEVVFELVEEPAEAVPAPAASAVPALDESESTLADEVAEDLPPAFLETVEDEDVFSFAGPEIPGDVGGAAMVSGPLAGLSACIESLGIELNDNIIGGLFQEINALRQKWSDRPLEKTFLQLLSTITQHIDQYRFEASSEAHSLLLSVSAALAARREDDVVYNQELLLAETLKVLEWQQGMLVRQSVQKGEQLSFAAPVRLEGGEDVVGAAQDFDQLLQAQERAADLSGISAEGGAPEAEAGRHTGVNRESLAAELKQEIASLRISLQKEIAQLRSELKSN